MADMEEPEADASELFEFLDQVEVSINRISVESERNVVDLEDLLLEAEALLQDVSIVFDIFDLVGGDYLVQAIGDIYIFLENNYKVERFRRRGRPQIASDESQLSLLLSFQFSSTDIASMLKVSAKTIKRRISQYGLEEEAHYSSLWY